MEARNISKWKLADIPTWAEGMKISDCCVFGSEGRTHVGAAGKLGIASRRRNAIEPIIGHMKVDGFFGQNSLKGAEGDK